MNNSRVIGIGGISRAGKSTLSKLLENRHNGVRICIDTYITGPIKKSNNDGSE